MGTYKQSTISKPGGDYMKNIELENVCAIRVTHVRVLKMLWCNVTEILFFYPDSRVGLKGGDDKL